MECYGHSYIKYHTLALNLCINFNESNTLFITYMERERQITVKHLLETKYTSYAQYAATKKM